jgi:hypothetical protein
LSGFGDTGEQGCGGNEKEETFEGHGVRMRTYSTRWICGEA